jgi:hypothetical protein
MQARSVTLSADKDGKKQQVFGWCQDFSKIILPELDF